MNLKKISSYLLKFIIFVLAILLGIAINRYFQSENKQTNYTLFKFSDNKISTIINILERNYVEDFDKDILEEKVISVLLEELDPHTVYIPAKDYRDANEELEGNFGGIGIQFIVYEDTVAVIRTVDNGPSQKTGIVAGDRIVTVNDSIIAGVKMKTKDIISLLKGKVGSIVKLGIKSKDKKELNYVKIRRDWIPIYSIETAYMLNENIGYIFVSRFARNTYMEFMTALTQLKKKGMKQVVIDLRNNSGGFMDAAVAMVNEFLPKNKLIVYTKGKARHRIDRRSNGKGRFQKMPIAILIDEGAASASEIFAGAIQDNDRGIIIGRRSFGKGLVQEQFDFPDGSALRLTVSHYYTPTGRSIQKPYDKKNKTKYYFDIQNRYDHGEFQHIDTTLFVDSLKKVTPGGKVVYGGGGIMPDVFVSLDTTAFTNYYSLLIQRGIVRNFAFYYTDKNRNQLNKLKSINTINTFLDKHNFMNEFFNYSKERKIPKDPISYPVSKDLLINQLKALIISDLIGSDGYYQILHRRDNVLHRAVEEIEKNVMEVKVDNKLISEN